MGNYIVQADLARKVSNNQLIQLTDDAKTGAIITSVVDNCIADAEAMIDSYLSTRYTVPLSPVTALVKALAVDLTVCRLYERRQRVPKDVEEACKAAKELLAKITTGDIPLAPTAPKEGDTFGPERLFTRDTMKGW